MRQTDRWSREALGLAFTHWSNSNMIFSLASPLARDQGPQYYQQHSGLTVFTFWPIESRVTGAGVVSDGLNALSLLAAGHILAGGCMDTEGSGSWAFPGGVKKSWTHSKSQTRSHLGKLDLARQQKNHSIPWRASLFPVKDTVGACWSIPWLLFEAAFSVA